MSGVDNNPQRYEYLTRICLGDAGTVATLEATARVIDSLAHRQLVVMVEPFLSVWENGCLRNDLSAEAVAAAASLLNVHTEETHTKETRTEDTHPKQEAPSP